VNENRILLILIVIIGFVVFMLFSIPVLAEDKMSKDQILKLIDSGQMNFERQKMVNIPKEVEDNIIKDQKIKFPNFSEKYFYFLYRQTNQYMYTIVYDWSSDRCVLGVDTLKNGVVDPQTADINGQEIPRSYCEKLF